MRLLRLRREARQPARCDCQALLPKRSLLFRFCPPDAPDFPRSSGVSSSNDLSIRPSAAASSSIRRRASRAASSAAAADDSFKSRIVRSTSARASRSSLRASRRASRSAFFSRSRTADSRSATRRARAFASSAISAVSFSRSDSSCSRDSSSASSEFTSRSPVGSLASARCRTSSGSARRRAMLNPYDRPGIPLIRR